MRLVISTLLLLFIVSCKNQKHNNSDSKLDVFNSILGNEKSMALNNAVASFDKFLERNFSAYSNDQERMVEFLKLIKRGDLPDTNWVLDTKNNSKIIEEFESSGLRRSFRLFGYEDDSLITEVIIIGDSSEIDDSIDSSAYFFEFGLFLQALDSISGSDTLINEYFSARQMGNIPYESLAMGELATGINIENPIHKRILIIDFYYDLMNWDIERNKK